MKIRNYLGLLCCIIGIGLCLLGSIGLKVFKAVEFDHPEELEKLFLSDSKKTEIVLLQLQIVLQQGQFFILYGILFLILGSILTIGMKTKI